MDAEEEIRAVKKSFEGLLPPQLTGEQKTIVLAIYAKLDRIVQRLEWIAALLVIVIVALWYHK